MEATKEGRDLMEKILPPRLEDAGLEDCALPPDSIQEAFLKAADAVKSRAAAFLDGSEEEADGGCLADPKETETSDAVVVGGAKAGGDAVVVVAGADGLKDLGVEGIKENRDKNHVRGGEEEKEEKQILV